MEILLEINISDSIGLLITIGIIEVLHCIMFILYKIKQSLGNFRLDLNYNIRLDLSSCRLNGIGLD